MNELDFLNLLVVALVAVFVVVGLALMVAAGRRPAGGASRQGLGLAGGLLLGGALGTLVWLSTGEFVFWVIFIGGGMILGLGIGSARAARLR